jgi:putative endonuclease
MTFEGQLLGIVGERLAAEELTRLGYAILATRYRTAHGELDLVCEHEGTLVFVEVKARATPEFGTGAECVTGEKKRQVAHMAAEYLARERAIDPPCRFDVVAIDRALSDRPEITVYQWAFDATG